MDTDPVAQGRRLAELVRTYPGGNAGLAEDMGVTASQVSRWRNGRTRITWERAVHLAEVLGVTPGEIYAGVEGWVPPHRAKGRVKESPLRTNPDGSITHHELLRMQMDRDRARIVRLERDVAALQRIVGDPTRPWDERFDDAPAGQEHGEGVAGDPARAPGGEATHRSGG